MRTIPVNKIDALARLRLVTIGADAVLVDVNVAMVLCSRPTLCSTSWRRWKCAASLTFRSSTKPPYPAVWCIRAMRFAP